MTDSPANDNWLHSTCFSGNFAHTEMSKDTKTKPAISNNCDQIRSPLRFRAVFGKRRSRLSSENREPDCVAWGWWLAFSNKPTKKEKVVRCSRLSVQASIVPRQGPLSKSTHVKDSFQSVLNAILSVHFIWNHFGTHLHTSLENLPVPAFFQGKTMPCEGMRLNWASTRTHGFIFRPKSSRDTWLFPHAGRQCSCSGKHSSGAFSSQRALHSHKSIPPCSSIKLCNHVVMLAELEPGNMVPICKAR